MILTSRVPVRVDFAGAWTDVNLFAQRAGSEGGAVVNAAINHYVEGRFEVGETDYEEGVRVSYQCDLPSGSGLGTSAALNVCWLSLVQSQIMQVELTRTQRERIAEQAYRLEELLGILGGKQDQYAAALGGFHFLTFTQSVQAELLTLAPETVEALERRLVLCYTGRSRLSGNIHENVWGAFQRGVPETVSALHALREGALQMKQVLLNGDVEAFGELIGDSWTHQKALDSSVTNDQIEMLFEAAVETGARHGKACGAGGGGCLLFFVEPGRQNVVSDVLSRSGARVISFQFDFEGLQLRREA